MLSSRVIATPHPRRTLVYSPRPVPVYHSLSSNSHGIISFADHYPLNPVISYRYKKEHSARMRVPSDHREPRALSASPKSFFFKPLRTLLRRKKSQPLYFQPLPHSLPKTTRRGYTPEIPIEAPRNCGAGDPGRSGPSVPLQRKGFGATIRKGTGFRHDSRKQVRSPRCLTLVSGHRERCDGVPGHPRLGRGCKSTAWQSHSQEGLGPAF